MPDQEKSCSMLSNGVRNCLHLALTLNAEANVLRLDEPTNDIDVNTLRALEGGLENFVGCASYSEYEEYKRKQHGNKKPKPRALL
jgi:ATPase subunit of ABC transporter with duplicated ATPase domains